MGLGMEDSKMNSHLFPPGSHRVTDEIGMHQRSDNITIVTVMTVRQRFGVPWGSVRVTEIRSGDFQLQQRWTPGILGPPSCQSSEKNA